MYLIIQQAVVYLDEVCAVDDESGSGDSAAQIYRGRNAGYPAPPAPIRTSPIRASGSYLGCLAAKRTEGQG